MYLYQSNRLECLFDQLCDLLAVPLSRPLAAETIVVPHPAMGQWLAQGLARRFSICAHIRFPLVGRCIWDILTAQGDGDEVETTFTPEVLLWRIFTRLSDLAAQPGGEELRACLNNDRQGRQNQLRRFYLASRITQLFDQYLVYRPDLLLAWEADREDHWQARLWRSLCRGHRHHRALLLHRFLQKCRNRPPDPRSLPERLFLFGLSSMAPPYLEVFAQVSRAIPVHCLHLNPCRAFWGDIIPATALARKRHQWRQAQQADLSDYYASGHPLLASLGTSGRQFCQQLLELDLDGMDLYQPATGDTLLHHLQNDILKLQPPPGEPQPLSSDDRSLQLHLCHSRLREIQVLHDRLLDLFGRLPGLQPGDILVMAPDISQYAPLIEGVFGCTPPERHIPWILADRTLLSEDQSGHILLELIGLLRSRVTAPEVMDLLEYPQVRQRFDISEQDLASIHLLLKESGIRWGLDDRHRLHLGLDSGNSHSWDFGIRRLLLGHLMGALQEPWQQIQPCHFPLVDQTVVNSLVALFQRLRHWEHLLEQPHTPARWRQLLTALTDDFIAKPHGTSPDPLVPRVLGDLENHCRQAGYDDRLHLETIQAWLHATLTKSTHSHPLLCGRVSFCNMVPLRTLPARVIWLLGMNDGDFPRLQPADDFDHLVRQPRPGDRNRRDDDRYLFLEAILSARDVLALSWLGRDIQDNSLRPPSPLVTELLDLIDDYFVLEGQPPSKTLIHEYPLHPFSPHCFQPKLATGTYDPTWMPVTQRQPESPFLKKPLPPPPATEPVDLDQLLAFWKQPTRFFLNQSLGMRLRTSDEELETSEPFVLNGLQRFILDQHLWSGLLTGADPAELARRFTCQGLLPLGHFGDNLFRERLQIGQDLVARVRPLIREPLDSLALDHAIGPYRLQGFLDHRFVAGIITHGPGLTGARERLRLWILHLVGCLVDPRTEMVSYHFGRDVQIQLQPVANPEAELLALIEYFFQGQCQPLPFYPRTSYAFMSAPAMKRLAQARKVWEGNQCVPGEREDISYRFTLRGVDDPLGTTFMEMATIYQPLLDHMTEDAAP